jgi:hypothetical protein
MSLFFMRTLWLTWMFAGVFLASTSVAADTANPTRMGDIGYSSVNAALEAVRGRHDVDESVEELGR